MWLGDLDGPGERQREGVGEGFSWFRGHTTLGGCPFGRLIQVQCTQQAQFEPVQVVPTLGVQDQGARIALM